MNVLLTEISVAKAAQLAALLCRDEVLRQELGLTEEEQPTAEEFLRHVLDWCSDTNSRTFVIVADGISVGTISLSHIDQSRAAARFGYWIGSEFRRRGCGSEAIRLLSEIAREMEIEVLHARVSCSNRASRRLLLKVGAKVVDSGVEEIVFEMST